MELLKLVRRRSFLSEVVYTVLNVALAAALVLVMYYTESAWLGVLLVLLGKWRILAVRPRYWYANFLSNLVDIIVSISFVFILLGVSASGLDDTRELAVYGIGGLLYIVWLLWVKPRSKRSFMVMQAGTAVFLGSWALFTVSFNWPVSLVVVGMWLIGYSAARHMLSSYDNETHSLLIGLIWGFVFAQIGWVSYHWAIAYGLPFVPEVLVPQVAIIVSLLSFLAYKVYDSFSQHQKIRTTDVLLPLLLTISVIAVLVFVFNRVGTSL
jgi:hypothetical protein